MPVKTLFPTGDALIIDTDLLNNGYYSENYPFSDEHAPNGPAPYTTTNGGWQAVAASGSSDILWDTYTDENGDTDYNTYFWKFIDEGVASGDNSDYITKTVYGVGGAVTTGSQTKSALNITDLADNSNPWTNPTGALTSNDVYASNNNGISNTLSFTDFNFDISEEAEAILGIVVSIERKGDIDGVHFGITDDSVQLIKNGGIQGTDKADLAGFWDSSEEIKQYGGSNDLWGLGFSIEDIESTDFGFAISVDADKTSLDAEIDHAEITVYYSAIPPSGGFNQRDQTLFQFDMDKLDNLKPETITVNLRMLASEQHTTVWTEAHFPPNVTNRGITLQDSAGLVLGYYDLASLAQSSGSILGDGGGSIGLASSGNVYNFSIPLVVESSILGDIDYDSGLKLNLPIVSDSRFLSAIEDPEIISIHAIDVEISGVFFENKGLNLYTSTYSVCQDIDNPNPDVQHGSQIFIPFQDVDSEGTWVKNPDLGSKFENINEGVEFDDGHQTFLRNTGGNGESHLEFTTDPLFYFPTDNCESCSKQEIKFSMSTFMPASTGNLPIEVTAVFFSQNGNTLAYKTSETTTPSSGEGIFTIRPNGEYTYMDIPLTIANNLSPWGSGFGLAFGTGGGDNAIALAEYGDNTNLRVHFYDPNTGFDDWQIGSMQVRVCGEKLSKLRTKSMDLYIGGSKFYATCGSDSSWGSGWSNSFGNNSCLDLHIGGKALYPSDGLNLYMPAIGATSNIDLYMDGHSPINSGIDLSLTGHGASNSGVDLYTYGVFRDSTSMNLYVRGPILESGNAGIDMFVWGTAQSGIFATTDLFVASFEEPTDFQSLNLTISGEGTFDTTSSLNLFLQTIGNPDGSITDSGTLPLVAYNTVETAHSGVDLYLAVQSGTTGAVPLNQSINLYIERGNASTANNFPLYISGPAESSGTLDLFLHGQPSANSGVDLYVQGKNDKFGNLDIYINGF